MIFVGRVKTEIEEIKDEVDTKEVKKIKVYKGTAKKQIKYAGQFIKAGDEFDIAAKDIKELKQYAEIEEVELEPDNNGAEDGEKEGE